MILFLILNILDLILTILGLKLGLLEGNILYDIFFSQHLIIGVTIKLSLTIIIAVLLKKYKSKLFKPLNIAFVIIVIWNLINILGVI